MTGHGEGPCPAYPTVNAACATGPVHPNIRPTWKVIVTFVLLMSFKRQRFNHMKARERNIPLVRLG